MKLLIKLLARLLKLVLWALIAIFIIRPMWELVSNDALTTDEIAINAAVMLVSTILAGPAWFVVKLFRKFADEL